MRRMTTCLVKGADMIAKVKATTVMILFIILVIHLGETFDLVDRGVIGLSIIIGVDLNRILHIMNKTVVVMGQLTMEA